MAVAVLERTTTQRGAVSAQEYLAYDAAAQRRSEWIDGEIVPMAGATRTQVRIVSNLGQQLQNQTEGRDCDIFSNDTRVRATTYYYPDVGAVCGDYLVDNLHIDTLTNPTVLIEVLSDSTETVDRVTKRKHYLRLPSLRTYLLVSQYEPRVEQYERTANGEWEHTVYRDRADVVSLSGIGCRLALADIYKQLNLWDAPADTESGD